MTFRPRNSFATVRPMPSRDVQDFISHWSAASPSERANSQAFLLGLADQLELRLAQARRQVDKLTPAILARAFAGKLVPQDPTDEPAEKLLERIQTSRKQKA